MRLIHVIQRILCPLLCACAGVESLYAQTPATHFEGRHCHPIDHTPSGHHLLAVNALEGRLSVFATSSAQISPVLVAEIPVGLEPVSVRARTGTEAWVVNEVSDTISIVDLEQKRVVATLAAGDEPADVVFANGRAFVSSARTNRIEVYDAATRTPLGGIPLQGIFPRALAASPDGTRVHAAFLLSGNNSTVLHWRDAPPQPAPWDPGLPAPPQVALLVPDTDPRISYDVVDHDIADIDTTSLQVVGYRESIGTNILSLACAPDGTLWAGSSEAKNLIRFEPNLNGIFAESRITRLDPSGSRVAFDLNPHATLPQIPETARALSLAQPMAMLADASGLWLAAFASDRIARLDSNGNVLARIDLRGSNLHRVRGPRGISRHPVSNRLYVLNKLSHSISVVDAGASALLGEIPLGSHSPLPADQEEGRGYFFDARLSGNGTVSCGSCHFDADHDGIAWDLGDPAGAMLTVIGSAPAVGHPGPVDRVMHPMKGPMVTQTLRGIQGTGPFHWRGDKATIHEFNGTFANLQSGQMLPPEDMDKLVAYLESIRNHPNPNRLPDNSLPATLAGGNPAQGKIRFEQNNVCSKCHAGPRGSNHILDDFASVLTRQPVKNATLEHVYKKVCYTPALATTASGFGFTHDGSGHDIPRGHEYSQDLFFLYPNAEADVMAFILCTETDTRPVVGHTSTAPSPLLEARAAAGDSDLVARASVGGVMRNFLFHPATGTWISDRAGDPALSTAGLFALSSGISLLAVPPGTGARHSVDRDGDGIANFDEPVPALFLDDSLAPVKTPAAEDWLIERSGNLRDWQPNWSTPERPDRQFFRLRRTW